MAGKLHAFFRAMPPASNRPDSAAGKPLLSERLFGFHRVLQNGPDGGGDAAAHSELTSSRFPV